VAPLFGDGSSAAVVSATVPSKVRLVDAFCGSAPSQWDKVCIPRFGHFNQNGNAVQGFAIRRSTDSLKQLQDKYETGGVPFIFIGHQANYGMLRTVCERCGIESENHWFNVVDYGNTGCSSGPAVLSQRWERLKPGDGIAMVLVGSGLSWASLMLTAAEA
jgi:3-oxoacyl-[acyl-carrier-protein] synthase-3